VLHGRGGIRILAKRNLRPASVVKAIVTCGPSYEPIDGARRITNFSTGRLGIRLANALVQHGWEVICFKGEQATSPETLGASRIHSFSTTEDLGKQLQNLSRGEQVEAIFHAAALCDFRVDRVLSETGEPLHSPKFSTREGKLQLLLAPTIKVLPQLRGWFPAARIAGWKYELAGSQSQAFEKAWQQIRESRTDACVLNGAAYGPGFALCFPNKTHEAFADDVGLIERLLDWARAA
jgi:phosphopantothenoylcysteine decarboxylase/phosphopantothenate--cysteine ligase